MESMLAAEAAILVHLKTIRIVLLVLHRVVIALLAFAAGESDLDSHGRHLLINSERGSVDAARWPRTSLGGRGCVGTQKKNPLREVRIL